MFCVEINKHSGKAGVYELYDSINKIIILDTLYQDDFDYFALLRPTARPQVVSSSSGRLYPPYPSRHWVVYLWNINFIQYTDQTAWLILFEDDDNPSTYWYYTRPTPMAPRSAATIPFFQCTLLRFRTTRQATFLFATNDTLLEYEWAAMYPVVIRTRDQLQELCYLSVPRQVGAKIWNFYWLLILLSTICLHVVWRQE